MLYFSKIEISEGIDVSKTSASKECHICHYLYFQIKFLSFSQMSAKLMIFMNLSDIAILNIKGFVITVLLAELATMEP